MLVLETVLRIRREHASGKAIKAIARDLHLSRKVVRKAIRAPEADMGIGGRYSRCRSWGHFRRDWMRCWRKMRHGRGARSCASRASTTCCYREGFDGSYDAVRRYAARWRRRDVAM